MVRKGQVHAAGHLSLFSGGAGLGEEQGEEEELESEGVQQHTMDHRDGGPRQLTHENQPYHGDESLLRRGYGGFGVSMHPQGFPLSYRSSEEIGQREDPRMHRYEQREAATVHQPVESPRWGREEEQGYEDSNKQLAVAQMMAEMHQGNMLQQRNSNLMMMASQMGQGRYHPDFLQTGGRMLFGAPPPRVSTEERYPYQTEMMRQNPAMMFGMAPPPIEKGRFEELIQQRGVMMDMAARSSLGDSRVSDFYLGRGGMVDPVGRETSHLRNHAEYTHPRVGMMMGMGHEGWRTPTESLHAGNGDDMRHEVPMEDISPEHTKTEVPVPDHSREHFLDGQNLAPQEDHGPEESISDTTPGMSIIHPNHSATPEGVHRLPESVVHRMPEAVSTMANSVPMPGVGSLGLRDTVAEMVMEMERRDREKMQELSPSEESSSSEQSESESELEEHEIHEKPKHPSIPAQVSPSEFIDETSKVLHPVMRNDSKLPQDSCSQDSGSESDDSSVAPDHDLAKNPSSVSSREDVESPVPFPPVPPVPDILQKPEQLPFTLSHDVYIKEEELSSDSKNQQASESSSDDERESENEDRDSEGIPEPKKAKVLRKPSRRKAVNPQPKSPESDDLAAQAPDIKSVRMPMWKWIGPKQTRSTRVTRQSVKKNNGLTIRLVKRKAFPRKRGRRPKSTGMPVTTECVPTAVPCAHPTTKRRGKVFQKVVMEDMVVMDGEIMTVNKRGRPRKVRPDGEPLKKIGRPRKLKTAELGPPKKRGRPKKVHTDGEPPKKVQRREKRPRKPQLPRNVKLISSIDGEKVEEKEEKPEEVRKKASSHTGPGGKDFGCPFCGKEFKCGFRLNKHMQTHIPREVLEKQDTGTIQMKLALSPDREKRMVRFDQCTHCKQLFMDLKAHVRRVHSEAEEHLCSICGHVLRNKESLVAHEKRHKVVAAGKKEFVCKECGADFFFQTGLNQHSKRHLVERTCVCEICGKAFKTTKDLEKHKLVHSKPHSCPVCKRRFGQKSNMNAHMRQHSGDKPFRCDLCSAAFTHNVSLKTHKKNTHGIDWWKENGKKEEAEEKASEKLAIMNACLDYFGTSNQIKWDHSNPNPNPNPNTNPNPNSNPNSTPPNTQQPNSHTPASPVTPHNPLNPLTPVNPITSHNSNPLTPANPIASHNSLNPLAQVNPISAHNPVNPLTPANPVSPHNPLNHFAAANPLNSLNNFNLANHNPIHNSLNHSPNIHPSFHPFTPINPISSLQHHPHAHLMEDIKPPI